MDGQGLVLFFVRLLAGTGVFLVGVHLLTANIEQLATERIRGLFSRTADKRLVNAGVGAAATALIQSSGVTTVLIVGFVNVGVVDLYQAAAMIMGANVGTTVTAQIAALSAFPITTYVQALIFVGILMTMVCKRDQAKKLGFILAGLGLIFAGLGLMSEAMRDNREGVQRLFETVSDPFLLLLIGVALTALVQSSSAITSIIIAMSVAGLTIGTGGNESLYIILGTNIGSCVTALLSSFGAGTNARRASLIHLMFNTFGTAIFLVMLLCWPSFMEVTFQRWFPSAATQIAMFHTFFNLTCTAIFLPFCGLFVKLSGLLVRDRSTAGPGTFLDERMFSSPALAIGQLEKETLRLSDMAMDAFRTAYQSFVRGDESLIDPAKARIGQAGEVYRNAMNYLVRLSAQSGLAEEQSISDLHSNLSDVMRIAEIADNLTKYTSRSLKLGQEFSGAVKVELGQMVDCVERLYGVTRELFEKKDFRLLLQVDEMEEELDGYRKRLTENHIQRLKEGICKPENSGVFISLVSNLERLGDHLTYVAHTAADGAALGRGERASGGGTV